MSSASFTFIGPGFKERTTILSTGFTEIFYERAKEVPASVVVTLERLREVMEKNGFVERDGQWNSQDSLVSMIPCLEATFVQAVNVALHFDTPNDPRPWIGQLEQFFGCLGFRFAVDKKTSNVGDAVQNSLASQLWVSRKTTKDVKS